MLPASIVPKSGQVLWSHHCRVSSMTSLLHLHMMIRQMVSRGLVYPQRVSRLTYTAPENPQPVIPDGDASGLPPPRAATATSSYIYALGSVDPRFPRLAVEREV